MTVLFGTGSSAFLDLTHAPWWCGLLAALGILVVIALQSIFPQESADRLALWTKILSQRSRRRSRPLPASGPKVGETKADIKLLLSFR
jgi:hypothetical protein